VDLKTLWRKFYKDEREAFDYSGRLMKLSDEGKDESEFCPTIEHIRPKSKGGDENEGNLLICSRITNLEKGDSFPTWNANGKTFQVKRVKGQRGVYEIWGSKK